MRDIRFASAQFEHRDGDKLANLSRIRELTRQAVEQGAEVVCFHECSIPGYTVLQTLDRPTLASWAEPVPDGPSTEALIGIAREHGVVVMAGLVEIDDDGDLYNCYVAVGPDGFLARHRKLHVFISPHLSPGEGYTVFDLGGVRVGILTCYDNNLPENARATTLLGAEVIVAPHVTGCLPSTMPGRGTVDRALWENRERDPSRLRQEFQGPKGRGWLMRWLPTRAWENGVYYVFSNPVGVDFDTIKPGLSLILDPHGEVLAECSALGDGLAVALLTPEAFAGASGRRYLDARRPELYGPITRPHPEGHRPVTKPGWALSYEAGRPG
ncbi:nitrilase family protein [Tautonia plasticadhaerens]|uniref:(R)-stereoselective amidase n=1 Tax=Tautonia plasticadhaerens TaxID=2527974 RepID=A0A518HAX7_9BACT|nr:nitrilase family protein [Tautonia plasticadhaerens]QDV37967.1 (R)-stereoselective amidase [Tautonia plasticadhaerens]